ncbi:zinc ribbon domain-containing protein [Treponema parvum]|uniref:Zinc ribbon domain-containing protein n=1 Tax=Treponema parvum TaxID=138851 RepID=A0A975EZK2_9SPIR|nr:zinc ribbon domain-containing protein [Treponema parvum]QTQ11831.1 zinc ribbon domain-containing protein [Treponema parvum]QTQ16195.1 zinc ribbon domain-containing protein [Treponema parvum]
MKGKEAKFFCENCGAEVPQDAKFCRTCGRFFTSVRCPACGFIGVANVFTNGCPKCGYADSRLHFKEIGFRSKDKKKGDSPLPVWIYLFVIAGLLGIIGTVVYLYTT